MRVFGPGSRLFGRALAELPVADWPDIGPAVRLLPALFELLFQQPGRVFGLFQPPIAENRPEGPYETLARRPSHGVGSGFSVAHPR